MREVLADDCDQTNGRKMARGEGEVGGRAAKCAVDLAEWRFNGVKSDRSDYQK
jgi:hypothetical protein